MIECIKQGVSAEEGAAVFADWRALGVLPEDVQCIGPGDTEWQASTVYAYGGSPDDEYSYRVYPPSRPHYRKVAFDSTSKSKKLDAPGFAKKAAELMADRGKERDQADGERSMARAVKAFNAMTGHDLSTEDGWLFMVYLKHSRMRGGMFKQDDYEDAVAYEALMAEEALDEQRR